MMVVGMRRYVMYMKMKRVLLFLSRLILLIFFYECICVFKDTWIIYHDFNNNKKTKISVYALDIQAGH